MAELVRIEQREGLGIASIMASRQASAEVIGEGLGCEMPQGPRAAFGEDYAIVGTGPGTWLFLRENAALDFADDLQSRLSGLAAISDQSSGYLVQRLTGSAARTLLRRGASIDFHPEQFGPGSAATTVISHIGVILWQVDERPTYDLAVFRSYSASFHHWFEQASAAL